ncbi:MAG: nucleoside-diphosphate kinase [Spirochaetia bacterium]
MEKTLALIKPGILQRRIVGEVVSRIEKKGFKITAMKMMRIPEELAEEHYAEHKGKDFYLPLIEYMTSSPCIAMILERENAVAAMRKMAGPTSPDEALPGTIRGDYGMEPRKNILHASDSIESAKREIDLFFTEDEHYEYEDPNAEWF